MPDQTRLSGSEDVCINLCGSFAHRIEKTRGKHSLQHELRALRQGFSRIYLEYLSTNSLSYKLSKNGAVKLVHPLVSIKTPHSLTEFLKRLDQDMLEIDVTAFCLRIIPIELFKYCHLFDLRNPIVYDEDNNFSDFLNEFGITPKGFFFIRTELNRIFSEWTNAFCLKIDHDQFEVSSKKANIWARFKIIDVNELILTQVGFVNFIDINKTTHQRVTS